MMSGVLLDLQTWFEYPAAGHQNAFWSLLEKPDWIYRPIELDHGKVKRKEDRKALNEVAVTQKHPSTYCRCLGFFLPKSVSTSSLELKLTLT